ncbi:MAG TPA: 50S ribosomal protein L22 [Candidatus Paceibacterota bacterium]
MQSKATLRYLRIAPRKVRLVADLLKGKQVSEAQTLLGFVNNAAVASFQKLIQSAASSASSNLQIDESNLYIAKIVVNEGPKLKRFRPRARGRAYPIQKKTSHITVVLEELVPGTGGKKEKPAESPKGIQAGPPQSRKAGLGGFGREKKLRTQKLKGVQNRIFRRKAI